MWAIGLGALLLHFGILITIVLALGGVRRWWRLLDVVSLTDWEPEIARIVMLMGVLGVLAVSLWVWKLLGI